LVLIAQSVFLLQCGKQCRQTDKQTKLILYVIKSCNQIIIIIIIIIQHLYSAIVSYAGCRGACGACGVIIIDTFKVA